MKKFLFAILSLIIFSNLDSQNLIKNYDFEDGEQYDDCAFYFAKYEHAQVSKKDFGFTGQFSINFSKYQYRLYDSHLLAGFYYKNNYLLGGIVIPNEMEITRELSYENRIWPQKIAPSVLYYYKLNNWHIGAGFFGATVFKCNSILFITYNNEIEYKNRVFTEEVYLLGSRVFPISDRITWSVNFKLSFIKKYNFLENLTNNTEANAIGSSIIPSLGVSLNFE